MCDEWQTFEVVDDEGSAEVLAGRLRSEDVPAAVHRQSPVPGIEEYHIVVPTNLAHRARWVMAGAPRTDAELTYLATGELGTDDSSN
jgi:hypothetical protein